MKAYKIIQTIFNNDEVKLVVKTEDLLNFNDIKTKATPITKTNSANLELKTLKLEQDRYLELVKKTTAAKLKKLEEKNTEPHLNHITELLSNEKMSHISVVLVEEKAYKMLPELVGIFENQKYETVLGIILK